MFVMGDNGIVNVLLSLRKDMVDERIHDVNRNSFTLLLIQQVPFGMNVTGFNPSHCSQSILSRPSGNLGNSDLVLLFEPSKN